MNMDKYNMHGIKVTRGRNTSFQIKKKSHE